MPDNTMNYHFYHIMAENLPSINHKFDHGFQPPLTFKEYNKIKIHNIHC